MSDQIPRCCSKSIIHIIPPHYVIIVIQKSYGLPLFFRPIYLDMAQRSYTISFIIRLCLSSIYHKTQTCYVTALNDRKPRCYYYCYYMDGSCHGSFLPGTSLEPAVIPTAQASSFTLQYFPYYV